jgi:hypothetical protein
MIFNFTSIGFIQATIASSLFPFPVQSNLDPCLVTRIQIRKYNADPYGSEYGKIMRIDAGPNTAKLCGSMQVRIWQNYADRYGSEYGKIIADRCGSGYSKTMRIHTVPDPVKDSHPAGPGPAK